MDIIALMQDARNIGCRVIPGASMAGATSFRIGGPADVLIELPDEAAAVQVLLACREHQVPYFLLGNGSNLLVGDKGIRGAVLRLAGRGLNPTIAEDGSVWCPAGSSLQRLCLFSREQALSGLEFAYGIPGSAGGAAFMNAGAYGGEMKDVLLGVRCILPGASEATYLSCEELALSYRHSALMDYPAENRPLITALHLRLSPGNAGEIADRMAELMAKRQEKQPLEYPSAGSFFKRPTGYFAGALIEEAGLKGYQVGGAQVSEKHAGFVVNRGGATAADVLTLCRDVQKIIADSRQVAMEPEVQFIGEF